MAIRSLLVANRGEIAVRIVRAAAELDIRSVAVFSEDDAACLHTHLADAVHALPGIGPRSYLDAEALVRAALESGCDALHPGYGFLAESATLARVCERERITFVGPRVETLELFGDKRAARAHAVDCGVPVLPAATPPDAAALLEEHGAVMVKAVAGGGGRGMRVVRDRTELGDALERCASEAESAFGEPGLYVEVLLEGARHLEVQVVGEGGGLVAQLGERECTLQRRNQKLIEVAPSPGLPEPLRAALTDAAVRMASKAGYRGLGTFEFLIDGKGAYYFIEANPRLQVEHTVTEEVLGIDLVKTQLRLASGSSLAALGLSQTEIPKPRGFAVQARVNAESIGPDASVRPASGTLAVFEPPSGRGVRVDTHGYAGYAPAPGFDSLLAKVVVSAPNASFPDTLQRLYRALGAFRIQGLATNLGFLQNLLAHPALASWEVDTAFVDRHAAELGASGDHRKLHGPNGEQASRAGVRADRDDPLSILHQGKRDAGQAESSAVPEGSVAVRAPLLGTVVSVGRADGAAVAAGTQLLVLEAMKMEHVVEAPVSGVLRGLGAVAGDTVAEGELLAWIEKAEVAADAAAEREVPDLDRVRPDLAEAVERHNFGFDAYRQEDVAKRHGRGGRTARENLAQLCDPGSFREYGALALAMQRGCRPLEDLIRRTPGDGMVCGIGSVNGALFPSAPTQCLVMSYDYMVLAGTQGFQNHRKKDRMFEIAERDRLPVVIFTEGGGGRPGDTDAPGVAGLDCRAFQYFGRLSGKVPLVGVNAGYCFAGNAALLGCCDAIIATKNSSIGMGGPAMIEGGGLGVFHPSEVGPMSVQARNGVVDIAVEDEAEAVEAAKRYLSYFQGSLELWEEADQRRLRSAVPENRLRMYDVRAVIETLADVGSVLELRRGFGAGMVTALARIEGRPLGILANNPAHLAGAIDPDAADKAARFMQLCDVHGLPILSLCDTPGIMVGPEVEKRANVRHAARMFVVGANLEVPFMTIVLRKGYGLGAQAMAGGSFHAPSFCVAWPTGEFGGMGLEGAVKLGFRKELEAIGDPDERRKSFESMVAHAYDIGKAVNMASHFEIDDVVDPMESRAWVAGGMRAAGQRVRRTRRRPRFIDTW